MNNYWQTFLTTVVFFICIFPSVEAQVVLERVSITERADGLGLVIRNHLTMQPDSFRVLQPADNRIQFVIYSDGIESDDFIEADSLEGIDSIRYYDGAGYFAYEITMQEGVHFLANVYPDVNQTDILLALERVTADDLSGVLEPGLQLFDEDQGVVEDDMEPDTEQVEPVVEESVDVKESSINVLFGIKAGVTSADFYGVGYKRNARNGVTFAASASINFPAYLPYDLSLGLETGFYFTQKGFTDPVTAKLNAAVVEIDYIEIPILAKLKFREQNQFSPHIILGPTIGFLANAESVQDDGERSDLDEFTRTVDFGGMAGAGVDIRLGDYIVDLQIRQSLGFTTLFDEASFDENEKLRQLSVVVGVRF